MQPAAEPIILPFQNIRPRPPVETGLERVFVLAGSPEWAAISRLAQAAETRKLSALRHGSPARRPPRTNHLPLPLRRPALGQRVRRPCAIPSFLAFLRVLAQNEAPNSAQQIFLTGSIRRPLLNDRPHQVEVFGASRWIEATFPYQGAILLHDLRRFPQDFRSDIGKWTDPQASNAAMRLSFSRGQPSCKTRQRRKKASGKERSSLVVTIVKGGVLSQVTKRPPGRGNRLLPRASSRPFGSALSALSISSINSTAPSTGRQPEGIAGIGAADSLATSSALSQSKAHHNGPGSRYLV